MQFGFLGAILSGTSQAVGNGHSAAGVGKEGALIYQSTLNSEYKSLFKNDFINAIQKGSAITSEHIGEQGPQSLWQYPNLQAGLVAYVQQQINGNALPQAGEFSPLALNDDLLDLESLLQDLPVEAFDQLEAALVGRSEANSNVVHLIAVSKISTGSDIDIQNANLANALLGIADELTGLLTGELPVQGAVPIDSKHIDAEQALTTQNNQPNALVLSDINNENIDLLKTAATITPTSLHAKEAGGHLLNSGDTGGAPSTAASSASAVLQQQVGSLLNQIEQAILAKEPVAGDKNALISPIVDSQAKASLPNTLPSFDLSSLKVKAGLDDNTPLNVALQPSKAIPVVGQTSVPGSEFSSLLSTVGQSTMSTLNTQALLPDVDIRSLINHAQATGAEAKVDSSFSTQIQTPLFSQGSNPLVNQQWNQQFQQRIAWITVQGIAAADIQLNPPELGPISMRVDTHHEQTSVVFTSHSAAARDAIEANLPRLRDLFAAQGLDLLEVDIAEQQSEQSSERGSGQASNTETEAFVNGDEADEGMDLSSEDELAVITLNYSLVDTYI